MKMHIRLARLMAALTAVSVLIALAGCASGGASQSRSVAMPTPAAAPAPEAPKEAAGYDEGGRSAASWAQTPAIERMIIQRASLDLVVNDTLASLEEIKDLARDLGGYVANSNTWKQDEWLRAQLTLRVPAERMEEALDALKAMSVEVQRESLSGEDVTEEYTDLQAQLRNLEATEEELLALLTEVRERPGSTAEDILDVHRRVTEIRGEIERIKGRMQYLEQMTALATIDVQLVPDPLRQPVVEPGWAPLRTVTEASRFLVRSLKRLADVLIWIVIYLLPILLLIAIPIVLLVLLIRWLVRRRRARKSAKEAPAPGHEG